MDSDRAIAIVGLGAVLPDAPNAPSFWNNVVSKCYSIREVPPERWSAADYYDPDIKAPDKTYSKIGAWVRGFEFDWKRFRIPPRVAAAMDQGQQWAVTIAAEALADYGYPERPLNTERTAVILGTAMGGERHYETNLRISFPEYVRALEAVPEFQALPASTRSAIHEHWHGVIDNTMPPVTEDSMPGELPNIVSGRVANVLDLHGPNFITDAACASSLAALSAAIELLVQHQVDAVITGGVDRNMGVSSFVKFCKIGALSATGSRPFGDGADGFVMGEGSAAFLLKRLEDAERAGDKIYAVVRGVGGSSDGRGKGITAPNPVGQQFAIQRAWENAGLDPATAGLVEAHGTSTKVGDVVEVESLAKIFGSTAARHSIALGSVKSNIGHLKAGAGAAGLLKATLALHHKVLPPTLNAERPNSNIDFEHSPFYLNHEAREWTVNQAGMPRCAAVSAYGFGGTNFHVVLEEHVPGALTQKSKSFAGVAASPTVTNGNSQPSNGKLTHPPSSPSAPPRGMLALGAATPKELQEKLDAALKRVQSGWTPPIALPNPLDARAPERLIIDFGDHDELLARLQTAVKAMRFDNPQAWRAMQPQGIFRGSGAKPGKIAFLFPGQGSQYANMGRDLARVFPIVAEVFEEADAIMTPILGKPLTAHIFVDADSPSALMQAEFDLMQTAITQPAMLALDIAIYRLLESFGFKPDMVMGHSLGEYAALIVAGVMPFADALEAAAARGSEMSKVSMSDNGQMAAVLAPFEVIVATLKEVNGYVVPANINSLKQCVIGGESAAVQEAVDRFEAKGYKVVQVPVSHAFHTRIVAPASEPLRRVLDRLHITEPRLPLVANVNGALYPAGVEAIKDILQRQIASPVQWVKGLQTLYANGARTFVESGPKRALKGFTDDVFADQLDVQSFLTCHPKQGELPSFNQALCGLYAAGYFAEAEPAVAALAVKPQPVVRSQSEGQIMPAIPVSARPGEPGTTPSLDALTALAQALQQSAAPRSYDRNDPPAGSVVISGTGLGLPGAEKPIMDADNAMRILRGEQFVDLIPERFRKKMLAKRVTRLVKSEDGNGTFETLTDPDEVIKLAGRPGSFDLHEEYGVPEKLVEALDITTQLAMAAGLDALREAGIPLVQTFRATSTGKHLPDRWMLPLSLRDETGVIFASAFPGGDRYTDEFTRYFTYQSRLDQLSLLEDLRRFTSDLTALSEINRRVSALRDLLEHEPYEFDRRFLFRVLAMGHSQFAEYIGARGPNTHVNAACASTTQAIGIAEDWIRTGRCRRVIVIGADDVTSDRLMEWVGAGFLATGAAATDDRVEEAALPFDRRRHGTILGMGACALVVESEDAVRERGMRGIVEILSSEIRNSAYHGTRLDVEHIAGVMDDLVTAAERRFGFHRAVIAPQMVFMSHETFTPARGGSAAAEVAALRHTFGDTTSEIIVANTKGFTGHPMGVGIEDVIAVKILEYGIVPPVPNFKEVDPELGKLNLSRGGRYPVQYVLHLSAGFGSQISMALTRRIPGGLNRVDNAPLYQYWLDAASGYDHAETEVVKRVLRVQEHGYPPHVPAPNPWRNGTGPTVRTLVTASAAPVVPASIVQTYAPLPVRETVPVVSAPVVPTSVVEAAIAPVPVVKVAVPQPVSEPEPVAVPEPISEPHGDPLVAKVLEIVAEQTGYPIDMLDLDLDMEADLGIDTVKQAETFAAIRQAFDIPRRDDMKLRDYPTLGKVIGYVRDSRPDLEKATPPKVVQIVSVPSVPAPAEPTSSGDSIAARVLEIVAAQTGYPLEMLELDLDMEADLGIDTVKQAETFVAIRQAFDIPRRDDVKLRDYPTLAKVIQFVRDSRPELGASAVQQPDTHTTSAPNAPEPAAEHNPVMTKVLEIVAEQTGYPMDMLDLDLDMEADLGIDTVKQAETFAAIRQAFDIPRRDDMKLRDYPTLAKVIQYVSDSRPDLNAVSSSGAPAPEQPSVIEMTPAAAKSAALREALEAADRVPRRVPVPSLRPPLDWCKPTGVTLDEHSRVIVALDMGGVGKALISRLEKRGVTVLAIEESPNSDKLEAQVKEWLSEGAIQGVYWLTALDIEPALEDMDLELWRELNRQRVKNLSIMMRTLYDCINTPNSFLVSATRLGGLLGYGADGASAPLGGAVVGFTKAYKRERNVVTVKSVDFEVSRKTADPADLLIAETLSDPGIIEVGYYDGNRYTITLVEQPADYSVPGLTLNKETVFLVTGAAGGITSAIVGDLAAASGGIFYLLDLARMPDPNEEHIRLFRTDKEALKQQFVEAVKAAGEKPLPALIDKQMIAVEREEAALRAVETVRACGGTAYYHSVNLLDGEAVQSVVDDVRQRYGHIDGLVHAAGIEISRSLSDKDTAQFNLIYDVKADGFFSLLRAAKGMPIGATVVFASVAGRFGNAGQTDYSAANELLCKVTSSLRAWRPETRGIAIDWTAWGGIGMATRGSIPRLMRIAGIDMLQPESGVPTVRRELVAGGFKGEILVAGRLGIAMKEMVEQGGANVEAINQWVQEHKLGMIGSVKGATLFGGLEVETTLDPNVQPFLYDHQIDGTPVLPGVMGTEAFAQLASTLAPGYRVAEVFEEDFLAPFKFYRCEPQTLYLSAIAQPADHDELIVTTTLRSIRTLADNQVQEKVHFTAKVRLTHAAQESVTMRFEPPATDTLPISRDEIYKIYFHGAAYQVLERARVNGDTVIGLMANTLPPNSAPEDAALLMNPRLIELCFQTAGVWQIKTKGVMALPLAVHSVSTFGTPEPGKRLYALVQVVDDSFNAQVVDEHGVVYVRLIGYRTVELPGNVTL